ncbi:hypothetical protein HS088_TW01G00520 [Tripterygium wilfordii]|uniref:Uncharacterized protein n=1 Tax=Tripterygium wilfordii TaxID=458696 RepID=A0A7J7E1Y1_TRIWF|nr:hypothetical protein HS088_TW01G00520 [Tripterygium wilfordii]
MRRNNLRHRRSWIRVPKTSNGKRSVEVLPDLGNYPISDGPGVDPRDLAVAVAALGEDSGAEGGNREWDELEG